MSSYAAPQALMFADDGSIPNNPRLPFLLYRAGLDPVRVPQVRP